MDNMAFRIESDASLDVKCGEETVTTRIEDGARIYTPTESSHTEDSKIDNVVFEPLKIFTIGDYDKDEGQTSDHSNVDSQRSVSEPRNIDAQRRVSVFRKVYSQSRFDDKFQRKTRPERTLPSRAARKLSKYIFSCSPRCWKSFLLNLFPFVTIMMDYNVRTDLVRDVIAGLTVGIMHIPQGMAYGFLTNLPPNYGLYMSFYPVLIYFLFGSSKHLSVGTFSVVCLMIGTTVAWGSETLKSEHNSNATSISNLNVSCAGANRNKLSQEELDVRLSYAVSLTFMVGIIQLLMGVARLGFVTVYLSDPLISGFTTGAACHVYTSQIKNIFGVQTRQFSGPLKLIYTYGEFFSNFRSQKKTWASFIVSVVSWILLYCVTRFINHNRRLKKKMFMPVPIELIVVVLGTVMSYLLKLHEQYCVEIVGVVPTGLPKPAPPFQRVTPEVVMDAFALSIIIFVISVSMAKMLAKKHDYEVDANQEFIAFGFCNIVSSFLATPAASASMSRSLIQERTGGKTQVTGLVSSALLLIVLLVIGPYFETLPKCILAAIIMEKMRGLLLQVRDLKKLWQTSLTDSLVWIVAFVATVLLDVVVGLGAAVGFAMLTTIYRSQRPYVCLMGRIPGTDFFQDILVYKQAKEIPGVKIVRGEYSPLFVNIEYFREKLYKMTINPLKLIVFRKQEEESKATSRSKTSLTGNVKEDFEMEISQPAEHPKVHVQTEDLTMENSSSFKHDELTSTCGIHTIILDCSSWSFVDTVGLDALKSIIVEYKKAGLKFLIANCKDGIRETFEKTNMFTVIDRNDVFVTLHDAVQHAKPGYRTLNGVSCQNSEEKSILDEFNDRLRQDTGLNNTTSNSTQDLL